MLLASDIYHLMYKSRLPYFSKEVSFRRTITVGHFGNENKAGNQLFKVIERSSLKSSPLVTCERSKCFFE